MLTACSCDAGGGTVDLISYRVTQRHPTFKIEEAAVGSGDKCGATYVEKVRAKILDLEEVTDSSILGIFEMVRTMDWTRSFQEYTQRENSTW